MTRIQSIHWKEFEKFLLKIGCVFKREKGDHRIYWKKGMKRPIVIPRDTSLPAFIVSNNLKSLNISREEYLKIIKKL
ncbi:MAG: type II toxin-antitoxin system HicA family toxin [Candidatus Nomurabacteria bacterium]|nr:type II toxin-antitoxin system HicA family toxin [Candidatus Nomurabacteria bacterium]